MQLIEKYVRENPCTRNGCYINSAKGYWTRSVDHQCLFSRLGCVPMSRYDDMMNNNSFKIISSQVYGRDEQFPYCLMHFQGENAKVLIKVLSKYLLPLASNGLHETINVTYIPTRGIARQTPLYSGEFLGQLANESRSVWTSPSPHPHHHKANKHGHDTTKSHSVGHTQNRKYLRVAKFFNVTKHQSTAKTYEDLVSLSKKFDHQILNDLVFSPLAIRPKLDRQIYLVHKGYAYGVPNIDVFTENLKLTFNHVVHNVPSEFFNMIPFGVEPNTTTPR